MRQLKKEMIKLAALTLAVSFSVSSFAQSTSGSTRFKFDSNGDLKIDPKLDLKDLPQISDSEKAARSDLRFKFKKNLVHVETFFLSQPDKKNLMSRWENLIGQKIEIEPSFILDQGELFRITLPYSKNDIGSYLMNAGTPNEILVNKKLSIKMPADTSIEQMVSILPQVITEAYNIIQLANADEGNDFRYIYNNSIKPARACLIARTYEECLKKIGPWELWIALNHSVLTSETLKRENLLDTVPALAGVESIRLDHARQIANSPGGDLKSLYRQKYFPLFSTDYYGEKTPPAPVGMSSSSRK